MVTKTKLKKKKKKIIEIENKVTDRSSLIKKTDFNTKFPEI